MFTAWREGFAVSRFGNLRTGSGVRVRACLLPAERCSPWHLGRGWSEPGFAVGEVGFAGVLGQEGLECCDDLAGVSSGTPVGAGDEDHAVVSLPAGGDRLVMGRPEVRQVAGDGGAVLGPGEGKDLGVGERFAVGVAGDGLSVVAAMAEFAGYGRAEHLVRQQLHRRTAACPARKAA